MVKREGDISHPPTSSFDPTITPTKWKNLNCPAFMVLIRRDHAEATNTGDDALPIHHRSSPFVSPPSPSPAIHRQRPQQGSSCTTARETPNGSAPHRSVGTAPSHHIPDAALLGLDYSFPPAIPSYHHARSCSAVHCVLYNVHHSQWCDKLGRRGEVRHCAVMRCRSREFLVWCEVPTQRPGEVVRHLSHHAPMPVGPGG